MKNGNSFSRVLVLLALICISSCKTRNQRPEGPNNIETPKSTTPIQRLNLSDLAGNLMPRESMPKPKIKVGSIAWMNASFPVLNFSKPSNVVKYRRDFVELEICDTKTSKCRKKISIPSSLVVVDIKDQAVHSAKARECFLTSIDSKPTCGSWSDQTVIRGSQITLSEEQNTLVRDIDQLLQDKSNLILNFMNQNLNLINNFEAADAPMPGYENVIASLYNLQTMGPVGLYYLAERKILTTLAIDFDAAKHARNQQSHLSLGLADDSMENSTIQEQLQRRWAQEDNDKAESQNDAEEKWVTKIAVVGTLGTFGAAGSLLSGIVATTGYYDELFGNWRIESAKQDLEELKKFKSDLASGRADFNPEQVLNARLQTNPVIPNQDGSWISKKTRPARSAIKSVWIEHSKAKSLVTAETRSYFSERFTEMNNLDVRLKSILAGNSNTSFVTADGFPEEKILSDMKNEIASGEGEIKRLETLKYKKTNRAKISSPIGIVASITTTLGAFIAGQALSLTGGSSTVKIKNNWIDFFDRTNAITSQIDSKSYKLSLTNKNSR